jgi:hypothetical protein
MPDTNSLKVTRAEEDLTIMLFEREPDDTSLSRKWSCPGDHTIAVFTDGSLSNCRRAWVQFHLSGCRRCRLLVSDTVKAQRKSDIPLAPVQLIQKAMGLVARRRATRRWTWVPAGALAGIVSLAIVMLVVRKPQQLVVVEPPVPAAPLVAKSEAPPLRHTPVNDVVRKRATPELLPTILSPRTGDIMHKDRLRFSWQAVPHSRNYELRVTKTDGDLIWEGQTDKSALQLPPELTVKDGSYFVLITAYLEDGRTAKSPPVQFRVKR